MKYFIFIFLLLSTLSCNSQKKKIENELKECIQENINSKNLYKIDSSIGIDIYSIVIEAEKSLKKKGYLKNNKSKKAYLKLVDIITNSKKITLLNDLYSDLSNIGESNNYNGGYIGNIVLQNCPHFIAEKVRDSTFSIKKQVEALDKLYAFDPYDQDYIKEVINSVSDKDFKNVIYRTPVYVILYDFIKHRLKN